MKQTALQDLIDKLKQFKKFPMVDQPTIDAAIEFAELRLEMEKEQIKKIASYWQKMGILVATKVPNRKTFEQWFSETYGGNK